MLRGYDVSEFQQAINFEAVRADFLVIRDVYSTTHVDDRFASNQAQARQLNIMRWYYSFVEPEFTHPLDAVRFTLAQHGNYWPGEGQAIDVERDIGASLVEWVRIWAQSFIAAVGFPPAAYLNRDLLAKYDWSPVIALNCGLWLAVGDNVPDDFAFELHGWSVLAMKQYALDGPPAPGFTTNLDYDTFNGDAAAFLAYGAPQHSVPTPPPPPPPAPPPPVPVGYPYTIRAGDTLSDIAARCGIAWRDLWRFDGNQSVIADPNLIYPGEVIRTPCDLIAPPSPGPSVCDYAVQAGDTLSGIAAAHGMSWQELWDFADNRQRVSNPDLIYPGEVIRVPC